MKSLSVFAGTAAWLMTLLLIPAAGLRAAAEPFGETSEGTPVSIYTLENDNGMRARIMTRGATLVELHVPDRDGELADVVLGFDDVAGYESERNQYFGCTTGRVANRIAEGKFALGDKEYSLAVNNGPNHLHGGGDRSLDKVVWDAAEVQTDHGPGVRFKYTSPDGEEGYPGELRITVIYVLTDENELRIAYRAKTSASTPVNLTNHSYFNLSGHGSESVLGHELTINADHYTPTDDALIPTGELAPVEGTPLDFREPHTIGERIDQLVDTPAMGYDHNYVINEPFGRPRFCARLKDPQSGRVLTVRTSEPGVQLYSGNFLFGQKGKDGKTYAQRSAVCLETQHFPDSVNQPDFPTVILHPDETYRQVCIYAFSAE